MPVVNWLFMRRWREAESSRRVKRWNSWRPVGVLRRSVWCSRTMYAAPWMCYCQPIFKRKGLPRDRFQDFDSKTIVSHVLVRGGTSYQVSSMTAARAAEACNSPDFKSNFCNNARLWP